MVGKERKAPAPFRTAKVKILASETKSGGGYMISENSDVFEEYLRDIPLLHTWDSGKTWKAGGLGSRQLRYLYSLSFRTGRRTTRIVETGAGNSTLAFLCAEPASIVSVCPDAALFGRIRGECARRGIDDTPLRPVAGLSEDCLPTLAKRAQRKKEYVDIGLLDGGHGWPTVFVDLCYVYAMMRKGGIIILDDVELYSVKEAARFMAGSPSLFRLTDDLGKLLAFEKRTGHRLIPDFGASSYILRRTKEDAETGCPYSLA